MSFLPCALMSLFVGSHETFMNFSLRETLETKALRENWDPRVRRVIREIKEYREFKGLKENKDYQVHRVSHPTGTM
jgi:hypothetical protein